MRPDPVLSIAATEARDAAERLGPEASTEDRFRAAMKATHDHYMARDPQVQFRAAVIGAVSAMGEEHPDYPAVLAQIDAMKKLGAMLAAADAGLSVEIPEPDELTPPPKLGFSINGLWWEVARPGVEG